MRILLVGASGTIGTGLRRAFEGRHDVIRAGRSGGDVRVDIRDSASIGDMYRRVGRLDACVCVAESGAMDDFATLDARSIEHNLRGKLLGQIDLVLQGQNYLSDGGSFALTSGIFADEAWPGVTGGAVISGGLHSFVRSAAIELGRGLRVNVVSPTMVEESSAAFANLFPGMKPVPLERLVAAYVGCVEGSGTGEVVRLYG